MAENVFAPENPFASESTLAGAQSPANLKDLAKRIESLKSQLADRSLSTRSKKYQELKRQLADAQKQFDNATNARVPVYEKPEPKPEGKPAPYTGSLLGDVSTSGAEQTRQGQIQYYSDELQRAKDIGDKKAAARLQKTLDGLMADKKKAAEKISDVGTETATGEDWTHGVKSKPGEIIWRNASGKWEAQSAAYLSSAIGKNREVTNRIMGLLRQQGYDDKSLNNFDNIRAAWNELSRVSQAAGVSPWDYSKYVQSFGLPSPAAGGAGGGGGSTSIYSKDVTVKQWTEQQVKSSVAQAFKQYLGREATPQELKQIAKKLNEQEQTNPSVSLTTGTSGDGSRSTKTKTYGGVDQGQFITDMAKTMPGYQLKQSEDFYGWMTNLMAQGG